jgi:hypothetical protein
MKTIYNSSLSHKFPIFSGKYAEKLLAETDAVSESLKRIEVLEDKIFNDNILTCEDLIDKRSQLLKEIEECISKDKLCVQGSNFRERIVQVRSLSNHFVLLLKFE